jgi:hypothetical protein
MLENDDLLDSYDRAMNDERLDEVDLEFITTSIEEQLSDILNIGSKQNYLKYFEKQVDKLEDSEDTKDMRYRMYDYIIDAICEKYGIEIFKENIENPRKMAKTFYKFFVIGYDENIVQFLEMYIVENTKDIVNQLIASQNINSKKIENINFKISAVLNNIGQTIKIISDAGLSLDDMLVYIEKHPESTASAEEMTEYCNELIENPDEVFQAMLKPLINEEEGFGSIYTTLQMNIYNNFEEASADEY